MKSVILAVAIILLVPSLAFSEGMQRGAFDGRWQAKEQDGLVLNVEDNNNIIQGEVYSAGFDHSIRGKHQSSFKANVEVVRKNIQTGCVTRMYSTWTIISPDEFRSFVTGTG